LNWHASCIEQGVGLDGPRKNQWGMLMTNYTKARETAAIFAGAFITAMLFVSAATSLPIA
jgi:hypothetical protein